MSAEHDQSIARTRLPRRRITDTILHKPETPRRLMVALGANLAPFVRDIYAEGEANLDTLPKDTPIIWAMTHATTDVEMQSAMMVVGKRFDTAMADYSTHHSWEHPLPFISQKLAGMDNFYPVKGARGKDGKERGVFVPQNFVDMLGAFKQGKAIAIAAHENVYTGVLPDSPGIGPVTLASLAASELGKHAIIVPIAMDFHSDEPIGVGDQKSKAAKDLARGRRSDVTVKIGEPMSLPTIDIQRFIALRNKQERLTSEEVSEVRGIIGHLRTQGADVMTQLANLLPPQKRGRWGNADTMV